MTSYGLENAEEATAKLGNGKKSGVLLTIINLYTLLTNVRKLTSLYDAAHSSGVSICLETSSFVAAKRTRNVRAKIYRFFCACGSERSR